MDRFFHIQIVMNCRIRIRQNRSGQTRSGSATLHTYHANRKFCYFSCNESQHQLRVGEPHERQPAGWGPRQARHPGGCHLQQLRKPTVTSTYICTHTLQEILFCKRNFSLVCFCARIRKRRYTQNNTFFHVWKSVKISFHTGYCRGNKS